MLRASLSGRGIQVLSTQAVARWTEKPDAVFLGFGFEWRPVHSQRLYELAKVDYREFTVSPRLLQVLGAECDTAGNGQAALEKLDGGNYDLVLMDCQMPVMDGFEATREIRALGGDTPRVPIVAVTAYGLSGSLQDFLDAGFDDVIAKPYTIEQIEDTLERWLVERRPGGLAAA